MLEPVLPDEDKERLLKEMRTISGAVLRAILFTVGRANLEIQEKKSLPPTLMGGPTRSLLLREAGEMLEDGIWLVPDRASLRVVWPIQQMLNRLSSAKYSAALSDVLEETMAFREKYFAFIGNRGDNSNSPETVMREMEALHLDR